jgi:hypothetical protein
LLFKLRKVDEKDLIAKAGRGLPLAKKGPAADKVLGGDDLSELFGLEIAEDAAVDAHGAGKAKPGRRRGSGAVPAREDTNVVALAEPRGKAKVRTSAARALPSARSKTRTG